MERFVLMRTRPEVPRREAWGAGVHTGSLATRRSETMRVARKSSTRSGFGSIAGVETCAVAAFLLAIAAVGTAKAQLPMPPSTQFDITGFIQEATLDTACSTDAHCGGVLKVEGHTIVVPKETIVIFPANAITYQEMFSQAPAPYGLAAVQGGGAMGATGLALNDLPT